MDCNSLFQKYQNLFPPTSVMADMTQSCLYWGIECGEGWYNILDEMMAKIAALPPPEGFCFSQIKEKFGTLRVYTDGWSEEINTIIDEAEAKSAVTCESCGKPGKINQGGWLKCLCEECKAKK